MLRMTARARSRKGARSARRGADPNARGATRRANRIFGRCGPCNPAPDACILHTQTCGLTGSFVTSLQLHGTRAGDCLMANLNKVMLIGRLTRDPETRTFANGGKVANIGFAVNNRRKNPQTDQWEDEPV